MQRSSTRLATLTLAFASIALFLFGCDSGGPTKYEDLSGTVTGQVVDKATSNPIQGATVTVAAGSLDTDGETLSATTNADGEFSIDNVPVTTNSEGQPNPSAVYGVRLETPSGSSYRSSYRGQVDMSFGNTGNGPADDLVANMTFPLSKANGTISGKVNLGNSDQPLSAGSLAVEQSVPVQFDANGNEVSSIELRSIVATNENGEFTFSGAEVGEQAEIYALFGNQELSVTETDVPANESSVKVEGSVDAPAFEITDVSVNDGADVDTTGPSVTFTFNRPVAQNQYTSADASWQDGADNLVSNLYIEERSPALKSRQSSDVQPVSISFNSDRTELTVTPTAQLQDGYRYRHVAEGFEDSRFVGAYGVNLAVNSEDKGDLDFSIGSNTNAPAVPSVAFDTDDSNVNDDGTIESGTFNYDDGFIQVPLEIANIDNSAGPVKGYEIYYRTQNQTGRSGNGDQFVKLSDGNITVSRGGGLASDGSTPNYEQEDGIIIPDEDPATDLEFDVEVFDEPFQADDESYGPVEWKVRAVSINNVRSDFTDVITTGDNQAPTVTGASATDDNQNEDNEYTSVEATFSEPVASGSVSTSTVTLNDENDESVSLSGVSVEDGFGDTIVLTLEDATSSVDNYDVVVNDAEDDSAVTDLAGNAVSAENDSDDDATIF